MNKKDYFCLNENLVEKLSTRFQTPLLILSLDQIEQNYALLKSHLPHVQIYYAVKANPDFRLLSRLAELGSKFDVASDGEIMLLKQLDISGDRMVYANTVKTKGGFRACREVGVAKFTFDSASEIEKMAMSSPGATVLLRVKVQNPGALVDLNQKFGVTRDMVLPLLNRAAEVGLDVAGLCFHVGSQTTSSVPYLEALNVCRELFDEAKEHGHNLRILDIGGGFPIENSEFDFDLLDMLADIRNALQEKFSDTEIWAEPGRFICANAVNLITKTIGVSERNGQPWYFLDDGVYGTFSGVVFDHWEYEFISFKNAEKIKATFAGPSCDSLDVIHRDRMVQPLEVNDLLLVPACGAYSAASATVFNGFAKTDCVVWEDISRDFE